jgi:hypothetical protein
VRSTSGGFEKLRGDADGAILCDTDIQGNAKASDKWHGSLFVGWSQVCMTWSIWNATMKGRLILFQ